MDSNHELKLQAILHAYLQALDRGEKPERQAILDAHPELREELAEYFADASKLEALAKSLKTATFSDDAPSLAVSRTLGKIRYFGDYELLEEIARGGMGVVFKAKQVSLNRIVALKMILKGELAGEADIRRFRQEAEAAANLDHPNIVPIYEVGEHEGQQYFSMKLIEVGQAFLSAAADRKACPTAAATLAKVARAVHHAHQRGILHRDLKPSNILIDKTGEPHVADFGLAKQIARPAQASSAQEASPGRQSGEDATKSGAIVGTPAYMAPEQARAEKSLTTAVDVYSLGAVLYEWLTGRPPFRGEDPLATLLKVVKEEPMKPRSLNGKIDRDLETICLKCLEKDPRRRYGSAEAFAEDIERWLRGEPIHARPTGHAERVWRWCRRNPMVASLTAAVVVAMVTGAGVSTLFAVQARHQAREADKRALAAKAAEARAAESATNAQNQKETANRRLYDANMLLAQHAWEQDRVGRLRELLAGEQPLLAGATDMRGFEWHYWNRLCHSEQRTFKSDAGGSGRVAMSPDGKHLASPNLDNSVTIWDCATGRILHALKGHTSHVNAVAYSTNGTRLASAGHDRTVRVWDTADGTHLLTIEHDQNVNRVAFSPDGTWLASGGWDNVVRIWDSKSGQQIHALKGHQTMVQGLDFCRDGKRLASAGGSVIKIWNVVEGTEIQTIQGPHTIFDGLEFSPDGERLASGHEDHTVRVWDTKDGKELLALRGHAGMVVSVAYNRDGKWLASASQDQTVRLWNAVNGKCITIFKGHTGMVANVVVSPDDKRIASASFDQTVKLWDTGKRQEPLTLQSINAVVYGVTFSPDGKRLAAAGYAGIVDIWSAAGEKLSSTAHPGAPIYSVAFSPDGKRLGSGHFTGTVKVWDAVEGRELFVMTHAPPGADGSVVPVYGVAFSPQGDLLASAGNDGNVKLWDAKSGRERRVLKGHEVQATSVAFNQQGTRLASASLDGTVRIWDTASGLQELSLATKGVYVYCVAFSLDGARLASGNSDGTVNVWDASAGHKLFTLKGHADSVRSVAFAPDGKRLASASEDRTIRLWDTIGGQEVLSLKGHTAPVKCVVFGPDGWRLATAAADGTVKIWDATPSSTVAP